MLIAMYLIVVDYLIPLCGGVMNAILPTVMTCFIIIGGIVMLFGVVGINISSNLGSTVVGAIIRAIGYVCRQIVQLCIWITRNVARLIPRIFRSARRTFTSAGVNPILSNLLAAIVAIVALAVII